MNDAENPVYSAIDDEYYVVLPRINGMEKDLEEKVEGTSIAYYPPKGESSLMLRHIMATSGTYLHLREEVKQALTGLVDIRVYDEKKKTTYISEDIKIPYSGDGKDRHLYSPLFLQALDVLDKTQCGNDWGLDIMVLDPKKMEKMKPEKRAFFEVKKFGYVICHKTVRDAIVALNPNYAEEEGRGITGAYFVAVSEWNGRTAKYGFPKEWQ